MRQVRSVVLLHFVGRGPRPAVVMYEVGILSDIVACLFPPVLQPCPFRLIVSALI